MRDRDLALDLDLALATRARHERDERLTALLDNEDGGGFFAAVLQLLSE